MTFARLAFKSLAFYRRTHVAAALGVATAVAVLAGAQLVGRSVRSSLAAIASGRLGRAEVVVLADRPFDAGLGDRMGSTASVPLLALGGLVHHASSGRRAGSVQIYGIDRRFFSFHRVAAEPPEGSDVLLSPDLATELSARPGDTVLVRVTRPTDIPIDSLQGRKEDATRSLRLRYRGPLGPESMGEFSLAPAQGAVRSAFIALATLQRNLEQPDRVNAVLLGGTGDRTDAASVRTALPSVLTADDYGLRFAVNEAESTIIAESTAGLMSDVVAAALQTTAASESLQVTPVLTWLANRMTVGGRSVPYSLVTALGAAFGGDPRLASLMSESSPPPIVLNDWTARDLQAAPGAALEMEYFQWADEGRLVTEHARFQVSGVVAMEGLTLDRHLAPDYPGVTSSDSISEWNPPFPITLKLVRPTDEDYWRRFRTTPKAFVPLAVGQQLWRTRHGQVTSLRLRSTTPGANLQATAARLRAGVSRGVDPFRAGFNVVDVRAQTAAASEGTTDFDLYFASFSVFLMISALLLAALFFRLSVEQRLSQIGVLRAAGYSLAAVRRLFFIEGAFVAVAGGVVGVALAVGWAAVMMHGLRTWWVDAVGTTRLQLHIDPLALASGAAAGLLTATASVAITIGGLGRPSPRELLTGSRDLAISGAARSSIWVATGALIAAAGLTGLSLLRIVPAAGGFFGAGMLVLVGGLAGFRCWLGRRKDASASFRLVRLGISNASWRPGRSLSSAGLLAAAVFLIVSVDAFRHSASEAGARSSGTGGFALIAESTAPIVRDLSDIQGREALGLTLGADDQELRGVELIAARLRPGDDTSCLNLYQPTRPRVLGVPDRLIDAARFRFSRSVAALESDKQNPWQLLHGSSDDGIVPAIADATSLEYVFHAAVGDVIAIDSDTARPLRLRIVASLADSMLQGELLISERAFLRVFPETVGYRVFLIDVTPASRERLDQVTRVLEDRLQPFGLDVQESARRLDAYHRVENTYLSTFQALGGLGLLLGSFGLAAVIARNVLERRRELALLGATGYARRHLQVVVLAETFALVTVGLIIGVAAALVAIAPVLLARHGRLPRLPMAWLAVIVATSLVSALWATRHVRRLRLVESLRSE